MTSTRCVGPKPGAAGQRHRWAKIRQHKWANIHCHGHQGAKFRHVDQQGVGGDRAQAWDAEQNGEAGLEALLFHHQGGLLAVDVLDLRLDLFEPLEVLALQQRQGQFLPRLRAAVLDQGAAGD